MVVDPSEFITFNEWFPLAIWSYAKIVLLLLSAGLGICFAIAVVRHGPTEAIYIISRAVTGFFSRDGVQVSPRRVIALAQLAIKVIVTKSVGMGGDFRHPFGSSLSGFECR